MKNLGEDVMKLPYLMNENHLEIHPLQGYETGQIRVWFSQCFFMKFIPLRGVLYILYLDENMYLLHPFKG
jgi:hypothetical protein